MKTDQTVILSDVLFIMASTATWLKHTQVGYELQYLHLQPEPLAEFNLIT